MLETRDIVPLQNGEGNIGTKDKKWKNLWVENINGVNADSIPVGVILAYGGNGNVPVGYLLCDGSTVSRKMFPDLFKAIGTDYGTGDGSTTFNLPDYNQAKRFVQGSMTAGAVKEAGLPNIKGRIMDTPEVNGGYAGTGAFAVDNGSAGLGTSGIAPGLNWTGNTLDTVWKSFDASRSSAVYGKSDTVQPDAITARYIIKAFSGQSEDSALVNITNYVNDLAGKANRSLSNLTDAGKSFSFPSDTFVSMGITANGQTYTAPADGYAYLTCVALGSSWIACTDSVSGLRFTDVTGTANQTLAFVQPVKKGQTLIIGYSNVGGFDARFYYAQGEVPGGNAVVAPEESTEDVTYLARQVKTIDVVLSADNWDKNKNTYTYQNELIHNDSVIILTLKTGSSKEEAKAYQLADIYCESQNDGSVKIVSYGAPPEIDIKATIIII